MKIKILLLSFLALAPLAALRAEPVTLTRTAAAELCRALVAIETGFAPANAVAAADNINALRPTLESLEKGQRAYERAVQALAKKSPADVTEQFDALTAEITAKGEETATYELTPLKLTDDEIAKAAPKPAVLSILRRYLLPPKPAAPR